MTIGTRVYTWLKGEYVGEDKAGNKYYQDKPGVSGKRRRWVLYKGEAEATKLPPMWHAWMHYTTDEVPTNAELPPVVVETQTGTANAYRPGGHPLTAGSRQATGGDYEAWTPGE